VADELFTTTGVTYDLTRGWGGEHPIKGITVVVLTHNPPEKAPQGSTKGSTKFIFCGDGIEAAVKLARDAAKSRNVIVQGTSACQQVLRARLADEVYLHIAPIVLGAGVKLFADGEPAMLAPIESFSAPHAIHARYRPA
jgi:dihydrofolate reductase